MFTGQRVDRQAFEDVSMQLFQLLHLVEGYALRHDGRSKCTEAASPLKHQVGQPQKKKDKAKNVDLTECDIFIIKNPQSSISIYTYIYISTYRQTSSVTYQHFHILSINSRMSKYIYSISISSPMYRWMTCLLFPVKVLACDSIDSLREIGDSLQLWPHEAKRFLGVQRQW